MDLDQPNSVAGLSPRELQVIVLLAHGLTSRAVADRLGISEQTVKNHTGAIFKRLRVSNRAQAFIRLGYLRPPKITWEEDW